MKKGNHMKNPQTNPEIMPGTYGTMRQFLHFKWNLSSAVARRNLSYNHPFEINGLINGQGLPPVAGMRYGIVNIAWSGCGIIAVYNALLLLGNPHRLSDVITWGDLKASTIFGLFGTSPRKAKILFRQLGYTVNPVRNKRHFDSQAKQADICLFTFWNQRGSLRHGIHTVCVQYNAGVLNVYNLSNSLSEVVHIASFQEWETSGISPIVLYCVSK